MAAVALRIQKLNGFSDPATGGQNRRGARHPAVTMGHVVDHVTTPTNSVRLCSQRIRQRIHGPMNRSAEQGQSEQREHGRRRDGTAAGMRSQHGGRTGGLSSGRVLAPGRRRTMDGPTFVMVSVFTVNPASRSGNGGASSGPRLLSGQATGHIDSVLKQE